MASRKGFWVQIIIYDGFVISGLSGVPLTKNRDKFCARSLGITLFLSNDRIRVWYSRQC